MKRLLCVLIVALLLAVSANAAAGETTVDWVPLADTAVVNSTVRLISAHFNNTSGSNVTVTITDRGTGCGGGGCQLWSGIVVAGATAYEVVFNGLPAKNGFTWHAGTASALVGYASWK